MSWWLHPIACMGPAFQKIFILGALNKCGLYVEATGKLKDRLESACFCKHLFWYFFMLLNHQNKTLKWRIISPFKTVIDHILWFILMLCIPQVCQPEPVHALKKKKKISFVSQTLFL